MLGADAYHRLVVLAAGLRSGPGTGLGRGTSTAAHSIRRSAQLRCGLTQWAAGSQTLLENLVAVTIKLCCAYWERRRTFKGNEQGVGGTRTLLPDCLEGGN